MKRLAALPSTLLCSLLGTLLLTSVAGAEQTLRSFSWTAMTIAGQLQNGVTVPGGALQLDSRDRLESTLPIFELADPGISMSVYAITGEVRCEHVGGHGYLELWSHFADGGAYFSRTLGRGPMAPLGGDSDWRPFVVPFFNSPGAPPPVRLSFGVHHPGGGHIQLRSVRLVQYVAGEDLLRLKGQWWSEQQSGMVGGITGSLVGLLGGIVGLLAGSGRGRRVAFGALRMMQLIGAIALVSGIVALVRAQPYPVFYPLLLIGGLASFLPIALTPTLRKRYEDSELRRMSALDAGS
jgi:hypothetical protein